MAEIVYLCCSIVSGTCAVLLFKNYLRVHARILLWISLSFALFTVNNIFVFVDIVVFPEIDMSGALVRHILLCLSALTMIVGLTWEIS